LKNEVVLVTGASSGIGAALASEFASLKYSLVLVSRDEKKLSEVASSLRDAFQSEVLVLPKDLSLSNSANEIFLELQKLNVVVDILVNNAGFGVHGEFSNTDLKNELKLVDLQVGSFLSLTKLFLAPMISRKCGKILNVASIYSFAPVPLQGVYSACKAFMFSFSQSLSEEIKNSGVTVTVLCPGATQSEFRRRAHINEKSKNSGMSAELVARVGVKALLNKKLICVPGFSNQIFAFLSKYLPRAYLPKLMTKINQMRGVNSS
jgi:short-subunit dehydrogenase